MTEKRESLMAKSHRPRSPHPKFLARQAKKAEWKKGRISVPQSEDKLTDSSKITKSFGQAFSKACRFSGQSPESPSAEGEKPTPYRESRGNLWSAPAGAEIPFVHFAIAVDFVFRLRDASASPFSYEAEEE